MQQPDEDRGPGAGAFRALSPFAIGPDSPLDPADALLVLVEAASGYAALAISPDGLISTWNIGAQLIHGYCVAEATGSHLSLLYPEDERRAGTPERLLREAVVDGRACAEGWRLRRDGTKLWANTTITPVWDRSGRLRGFVDLTLDETARREERLLNEKVDRLAEAERMTVELGDKVIRALFSAGLKLEATAKLAKVPQLTERIQAVVHELDETIVELRRIALVATGRASG